jgi:hypothetical protein
MLSSRPIFADRKLILIATVDIKITHDHRIFEKSVNCIETINGAAADVHAARFQWHIG